MFSLRPIRLSCLKHWHAWQILTLTVFALFHASTAQAYLDIPMEEPAARAMLNRFGYGADPASLRATTGISPRQYLRRALLEKPAYPVALNDYLNSLPSAQSLNDLWPLYGPGGSVKFDKQNANNSTMINGQLRNDREITTQKILEASIETRLLEMANSDNPGHEVLLNFWLNHFSIHGQKTLNKFLVLDYTYALEAAIKEDSFLALLRASFFHPAMQLYLDNDRSTSPNSPHGITAAKRGKAPGLNENLARELLELHTLGVDGGYSQTDVQALAKIISGAGVIINQQEPNPLKLSGSVRIGYFLFDPRRHDPEEKFFLNTTYPRGQPGFREIERALEQLAAHPATAQHIAFKLAQRFLSDTPPKELVKAMADGFRRSNGRISETLFPLLGSKRFAESLKHPEKFKEPMDYLISSARAVCQGQLIGNGKFLLRTAKDMEQAPYMRTTPDGYSPLENAWLSAPAMAKRVRLAQAIANQHPGLASNGTPEQKPVGCTPQLEPFRRMIGPLSPNTQQALQGLSPREEMTALLASPEFMRR